MPSTAAIASEVETVIVGPPPLVRSSEVAALRDAITRCGAPIDAGTVEQICEAVTLAERQLDRIMMTWLRYAKRHHVPGVGIDVAPYRLQVRHHVVRQIYDQRAEHSRMLIRDPVAGTA
ncbi:MAG TPA: hypothetical protein VN808_09165 [Stellaceae bacterium]|nr:hypothetical protein [Stellaceae bacterium]